MENKDQYCIEVTLRNDRTEEYVDTSISSELMTLEDANHTLNQLEYAMRNHQVIRINEVTTNPYDGTEHINPVLIPIYAIAYARIVEVRIS